MLIQDTRSLIRFCDALADAPYLAVDTEFMRERRYYPLLCLVQVAHGEHAAAIDPLAQGIDMAPLKDLLLDTSKTKVLHAATQDLEIFLDRTGAVPAPVFDTQIAASVCGYGEQPGYARLVKDVLRVNIDKVSQATDWSLRPLSDRQVEYALGDVTHLCKLYEHLVGELDRTGRSAWVEEELADLLDPSRYATEPAEAWRGIKLRRPKRVQLAVLREVAAWRERTAMERDIPRTWVARNDALTEIAQHQPTTVDDLVRVRAMKDNAARSSDGRAILEAVQRALDTPEDDWPELPPRRPRIEGHENLVALFQALLRLRCERHDVAASVVVKRSELDRIATEDEPDVPALRGWRRRLFGEAALRMKAGTLALAGDGKGGVQEVELDG